MALRNKSFLKRNLTPKQLVGFGSLFLILAAIPITIYAVGNPVNLLSEAASRSASQQCARTCTASGYQTGFARGSYSPDCSYKIDNCCCVRQRESASGCSKSCRDAGYQQGLAESSSLPCSQRATGQETTVIGECCCSRDPLPDLQITNISWSQDIKSTWTTELPGTQNIFVRAAVLNKSNFYKTDASKSGLTFNRSSVAENVGLFLWFNGGRMFQPKPTITTSSTNHFTPNQSHSFDFIYHIKYRPWCSWGGATAKFKVCADPENKIEESDETNNCLEKELPCDIFNY